MRKSLLVLPALLLLAPEAFAAPILTVTPSSIELSPTQTVITFGVDFDADPSLTPVSAIVLNLSSLTSGLQILAIASLDPAIGTSGPAPNGANDEAGFSGGFLTDRVAPFAVGTVTVAGLTPGTPLVASGNFTVFDGSGFNDLVFGPTNVATVVPEPGTAALIGLGLALLLARGRSRD